MKNLKLLTLFGVILIAGALAGCGNNKDVNNDNNTGDVTIKNNNPEADAVINYNDSLVELASQCILSEESIWNNYNDSSATIEEIQTSINNTISECTSIKEQINELGGWEGDNSLLNGIIAILDNDIAYYAKFNELLPYLEKEDLTEEEKETYESLFSEVEALDAELSEANENLIRTQEEFAKNHGFELEGSTTTENESEE